MITQERVKELFTYQDGKLIRLITVNNCKAKRDDIAGSRHIAGYLSTRIEGNPYLNHRIIFLYHYGYLPKYLDHINGIKTDNRIENIRECTNQQNCCNQKKQKNTTSKYKGVSWNKKNKKWCSGIMVNYKSIFLGYFKDEDEVFRVVSNARDKLHGEFANNGSEL